jgi:hypothetical protein
MRTTLTIQDSILDAAKRCALEKKCTVSAIVEDALRTCLYEHKPSNPAQVAEPWPVYGKTGLRPGVDLLDNANLLDRMEAE